MEEKSKVLIIVATGRIGYHLARSSSNLVTRHLFSLDTASSDPIRQQKIEYLSRAGATFLKRFIPSEYGADPDKNWLSGMDSNFCVWRTEIRHLIRAEGIPYTCICCNFVMSLLLPSLVQLDCH